MAPYYGIDLFIGPLQLLGVENVIVGVVIIFAAVYTFWGVWK
jgi:hypothetical protein